MTTRDRAQGGKQAANRANCHRALALSTLTQEAHDEFLQSARQALEQHHELALVAASDALAASINLESESEMLQVSLWLCCAFSECDDSACISADLNVDYLGVTFCMVCVQQVFKPIFGS